MALRPPAEALAQRLVESWLPDETVLYVGSATQCVATRVRQFYRTKLGTKGPHAGGWFLKLLDGLEQLDVHYAPADVPLAAEKALLDAFCTGVSPASEAASTTQATRCRVSPRALSPPARTGRCPFQCP
ncbi:MAG TPA: hypothetical protein VGL78_01435 [Solirubrobacteraceae bacterium]|jgi:hypothetical protein